MSKVREYSFHDMPTHDERAREQWLDYKWSLLSEKHADMLDYYRIEIRELRPLSRPRWTLHEKDEWLMESIDGDTNELVKLVEEKVARVEMW